MKKKRKLSLKKVKIARINNSNKIIGMGIGSLDDITNPDGNCKSPSDTSPAGTGRPESRVICVEGTSGNECA